MDMMGRLYHLSAKNLHGITLEPRIPVNFFTRNGFEDSKTPRVCFTPTIDQCLLAMSQNLEGQYLYVHVPEDSPVVYKPSIKQVPDSKVTGELWVKKPVKIKCIGKILVKGDAMKEGLPFTYGDQVAELYEWDWKWVVKKTGLFESSIDEKVLKDDIRNYLKNL